MADKRIKISTHLKGMASGETFYNRNGEICYVMPKNEEGNYVVLRKIKKGWLKGHSVEQIHTPDGKPVPRNAKLNLVGKPLPSYEHFFVGAPADITSADQLDSLVDSLLPVQIKKQIVKEENDPVNHPKHYTSHPSGVECITITRHMTFNCGNAVKYLWRNGLKDGAPSIQDLEKAIWYINDEIKTLKEGAKNESNS